MAKPSKKQVERAAQLEQANKVLKELLAELKALRKKSKACSDLSNHLTGFYDEISRLAKGRTLIEATTIVVEQANDIIRDAKTIVENDVYLDRIKEFVPAGNNPVYPDVLVVARAVRQSLQRCSGEFDRRQVRILSTSNRARTVVGALECYLNGEEAGEFAVKEDVERYVVGQVDESCFYENEDVGEQCFDFDGLDAQPVEQYIKESEDGEEQGDDAAVEKVDVEQEEETEE